MRRLIRAHKLKAVRLGRRWRVDPDDLEAFINSQRTTPGDRRAAPSPFATVAYAPI